MLYFQDRTGDLWHHLKSSSVQVPHIFECILKCTWDIHNNGIEMFTSKILTHNLDVPVPSIVLFDPIFRYN